MTITGHVDAAIVPMAGRIRRERPWPLQLAVDGVVADVIVGLPGFAADAVDDVRDRQPPRHVAGGVRSLKANRALAVLERHLLDVDVAAVHLEDVAARAILTVDDDARLARAADHDGIVG